MTGKGNGLVGLARLFGAVDGFSGEALGRRGLRNGLLLGLLIVSLRRKRWMVDDVSFVDVEEEDASIR